jgi:hypothetical protein
MDVQMHNRLTGYGAIIDANVEAIRVAFSNQVLTHLEKQIEHGRLLFPGRLEEGGDVAFRDDQGVAGGDGEAVGNGEGVMVGQMDSGFAQSAEGAG